MAFDYKKEYREFYLPPKSRADYDPTHEFCSSAGDPDFVTAMLTSMRTVLENPVPMLAFGLVVALAACRTSAGLRRPAHRVARRWSRNMARHRRAISTST